jgi:putative ABC transport system permease protein
VRGHFPRTVALGPAEVAAMAGVIALICLLASLLSIRAALRIEPQQALGG